MQNETSNNPQSTPPIAPLAPEQPAPAQFNMSSVPVSPKKPWYKQKLTMTLLVLITALLLAGAGWAAWALTQPPKLSKQHATTPAKLAMTDIVHAVKYQPLPNTPEPSNVLYAVQADGKATSGCTPTDAKLYLKPISGGPATLSEDLTSNDISFTAVYKNEVAVVATPNCGSSNSDESIWYSTDGGKTFSMLYARHASDPKTQSRDEITSIKFSSDGKTVLIGVFLWSKVKPGSVQNVVKEIDPFAGTVKDLFTVSSAGVFLEGYNRSAHEVFYYPGCFNCDGNGFNQLRVHDLAMNTDKVLFNDTKHIGSDIFFNQDFSKALTVKGVAANEALGWDKPFTVEELNIAGKTTKTLVTINESTSVSVGYTSQLAMYYAKDKTVYNLSEDGVSVPIFTATQPISNVWYVSTGQVVASLGNYSTYDVVNYATAAKTTSALLHGNDRTLTIGVTWN